MGKTQYNLKWNWFIMELNMVIEIKDIEGLFYMNGFLHVIDGSIQNQTFQWFESV
jgi:hypothetical protein